MSVRLIFGANQIDRVVEKADELLLQYRQSGDIGYEYIKYQPITSENLLLPEDLAVTLLVNSRVDFKAFQSLRDNGRTVNLNILPNKKLEETTDSELSEISSFITTIANWKGFAASTATKVLHKKRPALIPILDNQAIFGAYMNPQWPDRRSSQYSVKDQKTIKRALSWIRYDLQCDENSEAWSILTKLEPTHSLIEIFDSIWWTYFRDKEPVKEVGVVSK